MGDPTGVGGPTPQVPPTSETSGAAPTGDGPGPDMSGMMQAPVRTLGDLKAILVSYLGEEQGKKFYNQFLSTIGMMMLTQVQQAAARADKAAKEMRKENG